MLFTSVNIIEDSISAQSSKLNRRVCKDVLFGIYIVHPEKRTKKKKQIFKMECKIVKSFSHVMLWNWSQFSFVDGTGEE